MNWIHTSRERFINDWYQLSGKAFFIVLCLLYFATFTIKGTFIIDGIAAFEVLQERGEMWIMNLFFGLQYLAVPLFLAWKFTLTAFVLWVGCFLFGYRITYAQLWKMVMIMDLVFVIPELLKVVWFTLFHTDPNYHDYVAYYPASLMNLFDYQNLPPRFHYPLKALNLFELIYWGLLTCGVYWLSHKKLSISALIVSCSYLLCFLLWLGYFVLVHR